ncbi:MAG: glycosyltransferase family 4 protein [Verrucomicrobiales bacterium]
MRVAFLTHEPFYPPSGGGSAEAIYLVEEMTRRGHQVYLFCPKVQDPEWVRSKFGVELRQFTAFEMGRYTSLRNFKYLAYPSFLQRMVEAEAVRTKFDLILSQHAIAAVSAGRLKAKLKVAVVQNFLDYLTGFMETWPPYLAPPPMLSMLKRFELNMPRRYQVDGIMTVSDTLADYFAEAGYSREKILPIYYGFDSKFFPFAPKSKTGNKADPVVIMHGSLDHHHLKRIAVEAMQVVVSKIPGTIFRFIGQKTSALENLLKEAKNAVPQARIETIGFVPYAEIGKHLAQADMGMVPYEESVGTHCAFVAKIVEYLAVGLPVVSTPLRSASRYFGKEPMVRFSAFNGQKFGEEMVSVLNNLDFYRGEPAQAVSQKVHAELDWQTISRKAIDFCEAAARR